MTAPIITFVEALKNVLNDRLDGRLVQFSWTQRDDYDEARHCEVMLIDVRVLFKDKTNFIRTYDFTCREV